MKIDIGARLGPYEVVSRAGAGGMGEVWQARDTRLERSVAIKVLPADFAQNAQLRMRFEREAKSISQLNHPHICTLYDVGQHDGLEYLVMEYLDGETLADRIAKGPLPLHDVLRIGMQIAEALDRAHKAGIVHRDLKPGNVMLTRGGAKLLDFGLAKTESTQNAQPLFSTFPTAAHSSAKPLTEEGTIVGTSSTWRRSNWKAAPPTRAPTSLPLALCCTRWRRASARSKERRARASSPPSSSASRRRSRRTSR